MSHHYLIHGGQNSRKDDQENKDDTDSRATKHYRREKEANQRTSVSIRA